MAILEVLIEVEAGVANAFEAFDAAGRSFQEGQSQVRSLLPAMEGIYIRPAAKPVPMFTAPLAREPAANLSAFAGPEVGEDLRSVSQVIPAQVEDRAIAELNAMPGFRVWPSSPIHFLGLDCQPFRAAVELPIVQDRLGVRPVWAAGARGSGVVVGILDAGVDRSTYPVVGGYARSGGQEPGTASVSSHGNMAAAGVVLAAPDATLYDYPFLVPTSGGAVVMLNAVLDQRRRDGTPHVVSNSWAFASVPPRNQVPGHEVWDQQHPLHRKIREVVASGATVVFAAGNCGSPCPSAKCHPTSVAPSPSIHGPNSLPEVITVAAVNTQDERIGYSAQGPGVFEPGKPDVAAFSHYFGNFGPGRPGGELDRPYDDGTSASAPLVAGVAALLLSARPDLPPADVRSAIVRGARGSGWNVDVGYGVVDALASLGMLR